ncbi:MAG: MmgE/PrpD family protein [Chloroflexi bacterium]|nr:MmgE/PrpD family protein [Chloroflexota bacterium]
MNETKQLAQFVRETDYDDIPRAIMDEFKIFVLDAIAAGFIGSMQPWTKKLTGVVRSLGGTPEASVFNQEWKIDVTRAALINGTAIGSFECEPLTGTHASGTILPALLAVGERDHLGAKSFLTALVLGAEIQGRMTRTAIGLESERGFHNPGTQGPFGAALAIGKLYGSDESTLVNAMGIAGSHACGLVEFAWEGNDTKRMHLGRAAQLGMESAFLAQAGFTGPSRIIEGRFGFYNAFSLPGADLSKLTDELGTVWTVQPPFHKSYACHATQQAVVHAIQEFKRDHPIDPNKLSRLAVKGRETMMEGRHSVRDPNTVMGGQYSLPFTVAVAALRDMSNPLNYDDAAVSDPTIRGLAQRIELISVETEHGSGGVVFNPEVLIDLDGQSYTLTTGPFKGSPKNPFTWEDIREKFNRYAGKVLDAAQVADIVDVVADLENVSDMARLAELVSARTGALSGR